MQYQFVPGQRVRHRLEGWIGEVMTCVPGNGSIAWYFVQWDIDGSEDRYTGSELDPC